MKSCADRFAFCLLMNSCRLVCLVVVVVLFHYDPTPTTERRGQMHGAIALVSIDP